MAAHIGDQLDTLGRAHQRTPFTFMGQSVVVAHVGHGELVAHITWAALKDGLQFTLKQRLVKVTGNW